MNSLTASALAHEGMSAGSRPRAGSLVKSVILAPPVDPQSRAANSIDNNIFFFVHSTMGSTAAAFLFKYSSDLLLLRIVGTGEGAGGVREGSRGEE